MDRYRGEAIKAEAMVKTVCDLELFIVRIDVATEFFGYAEIERGARYRANLARRDVILALGEKRLGIDHRNLVQNRAGIVPGKIEVAVIGHVDKRVGIGDAMLRAGELSGTGRTGL